jgi:hypothetical protein
MQVDHVDRYTQFMCPLTALRSTLSVYTCSQESAFDLLFNVLRLPFPAGKSDWALFHSIQHPTPWSLEGSLPIDKTAEVWTWSLIIWCRKFKIRCHCTSNPSYVFKKLRLTMQKGELPLTSISSPSCLLWGKKASHYNVRKERLKTYSVNIKRTREYFRPVSTIWQLSLP